jgi:CRP-like cAMP-binding protein/Fe-S-cluster-containing hydrogenase component 2
MSETPSIDEFILPEEEGLFARDIDGQLLRMDKVTADDFAKLVTIKIDGQEVTVPKAVPLRDSQGTIIRDSEGQPTPRATTIYDAASTLFVKKVGDRNPIPILCHQEHMNPVAVCRVCAVEIAKVKRGQMQRERKLMPACQHRVEETMEVHTIASPELAARKRVHSSVQMLVELLAADHLPPNWEQSYSQNELGLLVRRLDELAREARILEQKAEKPLTAAEAETKWPLVHFDRFSPRTFERGKDDSSTRIAVDHNQCILCDRCVRGCDEVKQNFVIGRTGKGYTTTIGFDLDDPMGRSSCVSCGECMISCPTGALVFRQTVQETEQVRLGQSVTADDLKTYPIFAGIPYKFLAWNAHSVERRFLQPGDVLCREGEPGNTAFLLIKGKFDISIGDARHTNPERPGRWQAFVRRVANNMWGGKRSKRSDELVQAVSIGGSKPLEREGGKWVGQVTEKDVVLGEMSCLNHYPRSATVVATEPGEVLVVNRNVLYMLQRNQQSRAILDRAYRDRALDSELRSMTIFRGLSPDERAECSQLLRDRAELVRVDRGQVIFRQGDYATDFFKVRLGFVKVTQEAAGQERVLSYLGPGQTFGEIGLLSSLFDFSEALAALDIERATRTATCIALDDVELVRIRAEDFQELVTKFPSARDALLKEAGERLKHDVETRKQLQSGLGKFIQNGLFSAQKLLVLDLESCTRCDECTRACSDTHDGITRLIREGLRFENFLVASSCRSCLDPYCLVGCPVDAIHRKPREDNPAALEIVIENHCIGCGQCSKNCPYGNISMHYAEEKRLATTCDLCRDIVGPNDDPSCVYACPHNAAFRMSGPELLKIVEERRATASV